MVVMWNEKPMLSFFRSIRVLSQVLVTTRRSDWFASSRVLTIIRTPANSLGVRSLCEQTDQSAATNIQALVKGRTYVRPQVLRGRLEAVAFQHLIDGPLNDVQAALELFVGGHQRGQNFHHLPFGTTGFDHQAVLEADRKSTRLNSSHVRIS